MYKVTAPSGETVYTHYDKWECETWIKDNAPKQFGAVYPIAGYVITFTPPSNGFAGMAWTD